MLVIFPRMDAAESPSMTQAMSDSSSLAQDSLSTTSDVTNNTPQNSSQSVSTRGHYTIYTPEQKAAIAKYAIEIGNLKMACDKFSEEYGINVKESTARQFKKAYYDELNQGKRPEDIKALKGKRRGRPAKNRINTPLKPHGLGTPIFSTTTDGLPELSTPISEDTPNSYADAVAYGTNVPIATVIAPDDMEEKVAGTEYAHIVGDMAISACITDLMNGNAESATKPLILVAYPTDGKLESQELSAMADVVACADILDLSLIPEDTCRRTVTLIAGAQCCVDRSFLSKCPLLKLVVVLGASYRCVDLEYASQIGVIVCNVPDVGIEEIADSTFSLILSLYRQTPFLQTSTVQANPPWKQQDGVHPGVRNARRIRGKTLGLIGLGKIGIAVAQRAKVFGFNVIFYDPSTSEGLEVAVGGIQRVGAITDVLKMSDCISLHCSLTEESRHIVDESTLRLMKRGAFLVNVADGELVDEVALAKALRGGKLAGAALDTQWEDSGENGIGESPLKDVPNLVCTPRTSWYSQESYGEVRTAGILLAHQALTSLDGEGLSKNCVNARELNMDLCQLRWASIS